MPKNRLAVLLLLCALFLFIQVGAPLPAQEAVQAGAQEKSSLGNKIADYMNEKFGKLNTVIKPVLMFNITGNMIQVDVIDREGNAVVDEATGLQARRVVELPLIVVVLMLGSIFFTFWYRWVNVRGFKHSIDVILGKYDNHDDEGDISHFRALTTALSATVGLGNIAGVAIAIQLGGPGAVFWMMLTAIFGMSAKFSSCTLSQMYRQFNRDGTVSGGPMYYLDLGLREKGGLWIPTGKVLGVVFAFTAMGGAVGAGNMFQSNQSFEALSSTFNIPKDYSYVFGLVVAALVGIVVIGKIKRVAATTARIVPFMCVLYVGASLIIIFKNIAEIPTVVALVFKMAFTENAFYGGMVGVLVMGVRRAAFSNEAGLGSAAIAHAAAKTQEPVREGIVAMIGPFIDTIIICSMTAFVVIITGAWTDPSIPQEAGVSLTTAAYENVWRHFDLVLTICILFFAYSTMISWCYYGERAWIYLVDHYKGLGQRTVLGFQLIFVTFTFIGAVTNLQAVIDFSDFVILCMAFPNILGSIVLAPAVLEKVKDYWQRYQSGEMKPGNYNSE